MRYTPDILGNGFEQTTIQQPDDYEGKVTCTLTRKRTTASSTKAVLHVHGFNDYFFQYEMADEYVAHGFHFYAVDLRKYGRSYLPHQKFNNVRNLEEYFADIDASINIMKEEGISDILLSGHSNGGLIVSLYALQHQNSDRFKAIFLNSPFFDFNIPAFVKNAILPVAVMIGKWFPDLVKKGGFSPFYGESLHVSAKGEWNYNLDWKPHVAPFFNYGWLRAIRLGQWQLTKHATITQPVLMMHSNKSVYTNKWTDKMFSGDAILNVKHMDKAAQYIRWHCDVIVIDDAMHDVMLSKKEVREKAYEELFGWLEKI